MSRITLFVCSATLVAGLAGTASAQSHMRHGSFVNAPSTPAPSPARIVAPSPPIARAPRAAPPVITMPSGSGRAALPGRPNPLPPANGAGIGPNPRTIPAYNTPLYNTPAYNTPLPHYADSPVRPAPWTGGGSDGDLRRGSFNTSAFNAHLGSSGFSASYRYHGDHTNLAVGLNSWGWDGGGHHGFHHPSCWTAGNWCNSGWSSCYWPWWGSWSGWAWGYPYSGWYEPYPVINTSYVMDADPALVPSALSAPAAPADAGATPSDFQRGAANMQIGRYADAATAFRAALRADPGDAPARRWLGISLLLLGRTQDGCAEVYRAYDSDPGLADSAPDLESMNLNESRMADLCAPVVAYAARGKSPAGYLTAAMLMQIRSRPDLAGKMISKARDLGLTDTLGVKLNDAMTH